MICFMDSKIIVWTFLHFATSSKIGVSPVSSEIILTASRVISAHQQKFIEVTCTTLHVSTANFKIYYTSNGSTNLKSCIKVTSCVIGLHRLYDLKQAYECKVMMTIGNLSKTTIAENLLPRTDYDKIQRENRRQCTRKSSAYDVVELPEFPKTRPEKVQSVVTPRIDQRS
ncbi:hypothetical protein MAR_020833 [Mya arenaria]|uniref:Uncharacterized protein n=1 Tax=Mya arenaria TaxID=6604 RepID=A0ABY7EAM6_MYAAR|nr:hypothetical protein MAR_020833 [Mya arenaria]